MAIHLTYGGSTAARTLACPGWVKKAEGIPKRPAGDAAITGSMLHEVMERCQREEVEPKQCLGLEYREDNVVRVFGEDDLELAEIAYAATNRLLDELDIETFEIEPFVQLEPGLAGGSIDLIGLSADKQTLLVLDYKFGRGRVSVKDNKQLKLYTVSAEADPATQDMFAELERIVFAVVQPQLWHDAVTWEWENPDLAAFEESFREAMGETSINPGPHCKFCPAEPYCDAKRTSVMASNLLGTDLQEELAASAAQIEEVEQWLKAVREEVYLQLSRGVPVEGWKVVNKRATRKWRDADATMKALVKTRKLKKSEITKTALMTPAQIEKLLKKKEVNIDLETFIVSESSGTTLAPESDKREAVIVSDVQGHLADMMK